MSQQQPPVIVTIQHMRKAELCSQGAREWFAFQGLSWMDFLENGISADKLDALNDAIANQVSAIARQEAEDGRRGQ